MNKEEFINELKRGLKGLPESEVGERISFYSEMIDDRIEEGLSEEDAVFDVGSADEIISQIISETPITKIVKDKIKPRRILKAWEIILIILGSPLWLTLLIAFFAVVLSFYVVICSLIVSLWAVEVSIVAGAVAGLVASVVFLLRGITASFLLMVGASLICSGVGILFFMLCHAITKGTLLLTRKILLLIKASFVKGE